MPGGPKTGRGLRLERRDPARCEDVIEVGGVITVQMGEEQPPERPRARGRGGGAHEDAAATIEEQVTGPGADQRRRPGALGVGQRTPTAQDDHLHGAPLSGPDEARPYGALRRPRRHVNLVARRRGPVARRARPTRRPGPVSSSGPRRTRSPGARVEQALLGFHPMLVGGKEQGGDRAHDDRAAGGQREAGPDEQRTEIAGMAHAPVGAALDHVLLVRTRSVREYAVDSVRIDQVRSARPLTMAPRPTGPQSAGSGRTGSRRRGGALTRRPRDRGDPPGAPRVLGRRRAGPRPTRLRRTVPSRRRNPAMPAEPARNQRVPAG